MSIHALIKHKSFGVFGYTSRTRVEWVTLENSSSDFKFQDVILKDLPDVYLVKNLIWNWIVLGT